MHKLIGYSYFDEAHSLILCIMQDVSAAYRRIKEQIASRLASAKPE